MIAPSRWPSRVAARSRENPERPPPALLAVAGAAIGTRLVRSPLREHGSAPVRSARRCENTDRHPFRL